MRTPALPDHDPGAVAPALAEGARLGPYTLVSPIASGGMATVYLARNEGLAGTGRPVALKVIHPHLARDRAFVEMFLDEARLASRISHPNACSVFDLGRHEGAYYLAMDYVLGETLHDVMAELSRRPSLRHGERFAWLAAHLVAEACEGLHAAHELRGDDGGSLDVVHRDVAPRNLFVRYDGTVVVVDFGIARAVERLHRTAPGVTKGSFAYAAPEALRHEPLDRRADVWSLGVVLWELLAARRLFERRSPVDTLRAVLEQPIEAPSAAGAHAPAALESIVMRALQRDPEARPTTAREMGRALRAAGAAHGYVGAADVADFMSALYGARGDRKRAALGRAARAPSDAPPPAQPPGVAPRRSRERLLWALGLFAAAAAIGGSLALLWR